MILCHLPQTEANREEYVGLYVDHVLNKSVEATFESFRRGFLMLAGGPALQLFRSVKPVPLCGRGGPFDGSVAASTTLPAACL